ncbi:hypothetical protein ACQVGA_14595, partial [Escherichia coli]
RHGVSGVGGSNPLVPTKSPTGYHRKSSNKTGIARQLLDWRVFLWFLVTEHHRIYKLSAGFFSYTFSYTG